MSIIKIINPHFIFNLYPAGMASIEYCQYNSGNLNTARYAGNCALLCVGVKFMIFGHFLKKIKTDNCCLMLGNLYTSLFLFYVCLSS